MWEAFRITNWELVPVNIYLRAMHASVMVHHGLVRQLRPIFWIWYAVPEVLLLVFTITSAPLIKTPLLKSM